MKRDMDFLESAALLIPTLTGMEVTIYDGGPEVLAGFERQYCFSSQMQGIYSAAGLEAFLAGCSDDLVYDVAEPLGSRLIVFRAGRRWVLLGPYVEEGWDQDAARILLTKLGASEAAVLPYRAYRCKLPISGRDYALKAAMLVVEQTGGSATLQNVETVLAGQGRREPGPAFPDAYHDISIINRRYDLEAQLIKAVSRGETETALKLADKQKEVSSDLRFLSSDLSDQITGAAIARTLVRMGARLAGLSAVRIDSISQEYAQKMKHTASGAELGYLQMHMVERFCAEVRKLREDKHSPCVRRAMDYMAVNLSQPLTVAEIAAAAGVERHLLTKAFTVETGMTIKQYLAKRRCEIAAELLRSGRASVQEAAAYVGYPDNNYFSKVFKANQGVSPRSCQRTCRPSGGLKGRYKK